MTDESEQPMRCESVEDRLLDLVYGELDEAAAREVRAHTEVCEGCRRSLVRLEGGRAMARRMPLREPGADLLASVREAARARAAETVAARAADAAPRDEGAPGRAASEAAPERGGWWSDLLRWLGSMAMGPQVAMATLLMLMIGIGLWSLPSLRGRPGRDADAIVERDPAGEVGPSRALEPAEPLAFDFDPRTRRLAPVGEGASTGTAAPSPARPTTVSPVAPSPATAPERRAAAARAEIAEPEVPAGDELALAVEGELAPGEALGSAEEAAPAQPQAPTASSAYAAAEVERAPMVAPVAPPPVPPAAPMARDEVARPETDTETALAAALHHQAREAAARGANAECARQYQALLARYPRYTETGRALIELAECERRSGRLSEARRALERAERVPSVRADATRELARLRMMEDRAASEAAAPDRAAAEAASAD